MALSGTQSCQWVQFLQPNPPNDWPNPSQSKNFGPTNQPNNPQPNRILYNQQQTFGHKEDNFNISQYVKVCQVLLIYQYLSGYKNI